MDTDGDWDFYMCRLDDKPAFIFLPLDLVKDPPLAKYPHLCIVRLHFLHPREDGLSSNEEFDTLVAVEDSVQETLTAGQAAIYAGRLTTDGYRAFVFYTSAPEGCQEQVAEVMRGFAAYEYTTSTRTDENWNLYREFLYPAPKQFESIQNRRVLASLEKNDDPLTQAREIDHWAHFPTAEARDRYVQKALELGYTPRPAEAARDQGGFPGRVFRVDVPSYANIDNVTWPLHEAATEAGGEYDGWESPVVRPNN
jgi:uncharacterized protein (TIGR01619 family)